MRLRLILLSLLLLPGFVLGPGWNLRICTAELLGEGSCCDVELVEASCCSDGASEAGRGGWRSEGACRTCCLDIDTSREQLAPLKAGAPERELERAQLVACAVPELRVSASAPCRTALVPRARPPAAPGGVVPLPLRI